MAALKSNFSVTSRESWKHEPSAKRHAENELPVAQTRVRLGAEEKQRDEQRAVKTLQIGNRDDDEEHRGGEAGDKDGETLRIGTQESLQ